MKKSLFLTDKNKTNFRAYLKYFASSLDMSISQLAIKCGLSPNTIHCYLSVDRPATKNFLNALNEIGGFDYDYWMLFFGYQPEWLNDSFKSKNSEEILDFLYKFKV